MTAPLPFGGPPSAIPPAYVSLKVTAHGDRNACLAALRDLLDDAAVDIEDVHLFTDLSATLRLRFEGSSRRSLLRGLDDFARRSEGPGTAKSVLDDFARRSEGPGTAKSVLDDFAHRSEGPGTAKSVLDASRAKGETPRFLLPDPSRAILEEQGPFVGTLAVLFRDGTGDLAHEIPDVPG